MKRAALPKRKHIRLHLDVYADAAAICSVTIGTELRIRAFDNTALATACVALLVGLSREAQAPLYAYCFMPDHLHLLLSPAEGGSVFDFVGSFKSLSTRLAWQYDLSGKLWQRRF